VLQCVAVRCNPEQEKVRSTLFLLSMSFFSPCKQKFVYRKQGQEKEVVDSVTHCNTLQHTATRCITLHHTATHCNTLQHTATQQVLLPLGTKSSYGVVTISRLLKIIGLFCKRALQKGRYSAKETYNFKEPTNRSHPIPQTTTHCNTHGNTYCNTNCDTHCNTLQHTEV